MFQEFHNLTIRGKGGPAGLPFLNMKEAVVGKEYSVSVNFISPVKMRAINKQYRNIDKSTDILSFEIAKDEGEIFICIAEAKKKAPEFKMDISNYIGLLFIHGLVHLTGLDHGKKMDEMEKKYRSYFQIKSN